MSLSSALSSAVSGLTAQSQALSAVAQNIANSSTTAYKTKETSFQTLLAGSTGASSSVASVIARTSQAMLVQGLVSSTSTSTNIALQGDGFFIVTDSLSGGTIAYTRDGSFAPDVNGNLVNAQGYYLLGFQTDATGAVLTANASSTSDLEPITLTSISAAAKATSLIEMSGNIPANAEVGESVTSSMEIVDSLGMTHTIDQTWTKTAANTWSVTLSNPVNADGVETGTLSPSTLTVEFDTNGALASVDPSPATLEVTGFTSGAADSTITLDLGAIGAADGLTQYASTASTLQIGDPQYVQDGYTAGQLSAIEVKSDGSIVASLDNGQSRTIAKVPVAVFNNPTGLINTEGTIYISSAQSGSARLMTAGEGGGEIIGGALEQSTTDTGTEFNKMIVAQQAYSAASQVVSTASDMFDTLLQAVR